MDFKAPNYRLLISIVLFLTLCSQAILAQNTTPLVQYSLTSTLNSTGGISGNHPGGTFSTTSPNLSFMGSVAQTTGWDSETPGGYKSWQTSSFSTFGYYSIRASATMYSQTDGPRDFVLEYKIGETGTWMHIQTFTVGQSATSNSNYNFTLPAECRNQPSLFVRWRANSFISLNGTNITAGARNYIKAVSITGVLAETPNYQAQGITLISVTPNTINVSCTPGGGDNRIIMIKRGDDSFTTPKNDIIYQANPVYNGTGEQIIYNGPESSVTVTVPSSKDEYYFRVYDYRMNEGVTRYNILTEYDNPKLCALENINPSTVTNLRLTAATLGATINTPTKSTIFERGILWSTNPGVTDADNMLSEYSSGGGSFSFNITGMPRGTTIYYKGYVTNESGTILSSESSFSNIPVFTGTGTWETGSNWNVGEIPGAAGSNGSTTDNPIIDGICTLTSSNTVNNLTINSGRRLTINTGTATTGNALRVQGTLINNAGTSGIVIKSGANVAGGSLIYTNGNNINATVEMYSKASTANGQNHWQYFGIPLKSVRVGDTFTGSSDRVRKYFESNIDPEGLNYGLWRPYNKLSPNSAKLGPDEILVPVDGYQVVQSSPKTYIFRGELNHGDISRTLDYTTGADWAGQHIVGNPFPAAVEISKINFGSAEAAVYLYNTGSLAEWSSGTSTPGSYTSSSSQLAGVFGTPARIPSMQGFLVKTSSQTTIRFPYSAVMPNTTPQRAPQQSSSEKVATMIEISGTNSSDRMWIFTEPGCTRSFDNGYDGRKLLGSALTTQVFAMEEDDYYQINAVQDITNTYLGYQAGNEKTLKLRFTHMNLDFVYGKLYLIDLVTNTLTDITENGTEYEFETESTSAPVKRFKIVTITTEKRASANEQLKIFSSGNQVFVQNSTGKAGSIAIYNMAGISVYNAAIEANGLTDVQGIKPGAYIARVICGNEKTTERLIIR